MRDAEVYRDAFSLTPAYLASEKGGHGLIGGDLPWRAGHTNHRTRREDFEVLVREVGRDSVRVSFGKTGGEVVQKFVE